MLLLTLFACTVYHPDALYPSSRPVAPDVRVGDSVEVERCSSLLFGALPLDGGYGMRDLLADARREADSDVLVEVALDESFTFWLLGTTVCTRLSAYAAGGPPRYADRSDRDDVEEAEAPRAKAAERTVQVKKIAATGNVPRSALVAAGLVYQALDRDPPADEARATDDARAVMEAAESGMSIDAIVTAAKTGAAELGADKPLRALIAAGRG